MNKVAAEVSSGENTNVLSSVDPSTSFQASTTQEDTTRTTDPSMAEPCLTAERRSAALSTYAGVKPKKTPSKQGYSPRAVQLSSNRRNLKKEDDFSAASSALMSMVRSYDESLNPKPVSDGSRFGIISTVTLRRSGGGGFNIGVDGGIEYGYLPSVSFEGVSGVDSDGLLRAGDEILKVGDVIVASMVHKDIVALMQQQGEAMILRVSTPTSGQRTNLKSIFNRVLDETSDVEELEIVEAIRHAVYSLTIPVTTRHRRETEMEGREYSFVDQTSFEQLAKDGQLVECNRALNGNWYGTPLPSSSAIESGIIQRRQRLIEAEADIRSREMTVGTFLTTSGINADSHSPLRDLVDCNEPISAFLGATDQHDPVLGDARASLKNMLYQLVVPVTTRPRHAGEISGREYNHISVTEFKNMVHSGAFLEYGEHNGHLYGTPRLTNAMGADFVREALTAKRTEQLQRAYQRIPGEATVGETLACADRKKWKGVDIAALASERGFDNMGVTLFLRTQTRVEPAVLQVREALKAELRAKVVPVTTRERRDGEVSGVDYHYVSRQQFESMINGSALVEWAEGANGHLYGSGRLMIADLQARSQGHRSNESTVSELLNHLGENVVGLNGNTSVSVFLNNTNAVTPVDQNAQLLVRAACYDATIPLTTRNRRPGELDGREYHFVDRETFVRFIAEGKMLEHGESSKGDLYGTLIPTRDTTVPSRAATKALEALREQAELRVGQLAALAAVSGPIKGVLDLISGLGTDLAMPASQFFGTIGSDVTGDLCRVRDILWDVVLELTVPCTTRPPRAEETDGLDYYFISESEFKKLVDEGSFIEYGSANDVSYGTLKVTEADLADAKLLMPAEWRLLHTPGSCSEASLADVARASGLQLPAHLAETLGPMPCSLFLMRTILAGTSTPPEDAAFRNSLKAGYYDLATPITTRPMRFGERNGREYNFVSLNTFRRLCADGMLLEFGECDGRFYGTPKLQASDSIGRSRVEMLSELAAWSDANEAKLEFLLGNTTPADLRGMPISRFLAAVDHSDATYGFLAKKVRYLAYQKSCPITTRPRRNTEVEGKDYHFVTLTEFNDMIAADGFYEHGVKDGFFYGTPKLLLPGASLNIGSTEKDAVNKVQTEISTMQSAGRRLSELPGLGIAPDALPSRQGSLTDPRDISDRGVVPNDSVAHAEKMSTPREDDASIEEWDPAQEAGQKSEVQTLEAIRSCLTTKSSADPRTVVNEIVSIISPAQNSQRSMSPELHLEASTLLDAADERLAAKDAEIERLRTTMRALEIALVIEHRKESGASPTKPVDRSHDLDVSLSNPSVEQIADAFLSPVSSTSPQGKNVEANNAPVAFELTQNADSTKNMSPLKARLASRKGRNNAVPASVAMSPLKLKLAARRKQREAAAALQE